MGVPFTNVVLLLDFKLFKNLKTLSQALIFPSQKSIPTRYSLAKSLASLKCNQLAFGQKYLQGHKNILISCHQMLSMRRPHGTSFSSNLKCWFMYPNNQPFSPSASHSTINWIDSFLPNIGNIFLPHQHLTLLLQNSHLILFALMFKIKDLAWRWKIPI